jgi:predicted aldo/keto reductase-like oxidoreductase
MFLATKFCTGGGNLPIGTSVADYIAAVEGSLERLGTDYVDLVHIHSCNSIERLLDPNVHEAFDRLRGDGKARFLGFSSHSPNLERVAEAAIESARFDVMMLAYHHGAFPRLAELIDRAHPLDMGIVAMKTLKGARHQRLLEERDQRDSYTQAAFKWVLSNPSVSCLVVSFRQPAHLDEYIYASGQKLGVADRRVLDAYDHAIAGKHCYQHCGVCLDACPAGLPIDDVLRQRMYFEDYGDEREAMRQYARLEVRADVCTGCAAPCATACPFGLPIPEYTQTAHRLLSADWADGSLAEGGAGRPRSQS